MYYHLAHLYDWPGALEFSSTVLEKDLSIFQQYHIPPPTRVLDLACGTGTLALELAKRGYQVTGMDLSAAMLEEARKKQNAESPQALPHPVQWIQEDMRSFLTGTSYDAVLCHYDSLNHLSNETELRATLLHIAMALSPGGILLFDLNTLENYQNFWNGTDSYEGPNYRLKTTAQFDEDTGHAKAVYEADEYTDKGLTHHSETLHEQYFNPLAVEKYLRAAGFEVITCEDFYPLPLSLSLPPTSNPVASEPIFLKHFWLAQKEKD